MNARHILIALAFTASAALAACGGGGGGGYNPPAGGGTGGGNGTTGGTVATTPPPVAPLTIGVSLPTSEIGVVNDPTYGIVGGYTQQSFSQVLGFAPGAQVSIKNLSSTLPHTLNVLSTTAFPASGTAISAGASGGSTIASGFGSGNIAAGATVGPFTLSAGVYYIGCAYHYSSNGMRSALVVSSTAVPGVQATPQPSPPQPPGPGNGYGY